MWKRVILILLIPVYSQAQIHEWQGNRWLKEFEKVVDNAFLYDQQTKADRINIKHKYTSLQKNVWLKSGVYTEHLSAGLKQTRLRLVLFGRKRAVESILEIEGLSNFRDYYKALPFNLYLGDSFDEIDERLGGISNPFVTDVSDTHKILKIPDIPPFLGLDADLHFFDGKLEALELSLDAGLAESYPERLSEISSIDFLDVKGTLSEAHARDKKIYMGLMRVMVKKFVETGTNSKPYRDMYSLQLASRSDYTTSYDNLNMNVVWGYDDLKYPQYLFETFLHSTTIPLYKPYYGKFYDNLLVSDYKMVKLGEYNYVFHDPNDQYDRRISNLLFHLYWDKKNRKMVLSVKYPQTFNSANPFKPEYVKPAPLSTTTSFIDRATNKSKAKEDKREKQILANLPRLKGELALHPGNQFLMLIGTHPDDFVKLRGLHPTFKREGDKFYIEKLNFWMGTQKKNYYKGNAPYGLTHKMKFEDAVKQFPGMKPYSAYFDGYRTEIKHTVKLTEDVSLSFKLIFHKDKLQNILATVNKPLSKDWELLKDKIFY